MAKKFLDENGLLYFWQKLVNKFVAKETGKGLSTNDFTTEEKAKLAGLENYTLPTASATVKGGIKVGAGLAMNGEVLSATGGGTADAVDWSNVTNKPETFAPSTHTHAASEVTGLAKVATSGSYNDLSDKPTNFAPAAHTHNMSDVTGLSDALGGKADADHTHTKADIGLGNVDNTSDADKPISAATQTALNDKVNKAVLGQASGVATLDETGKVPSTQLPSYVDDVVEGYYSDGKFYKEETHTTEIAGEGGKIYVDLTSNLSYRYGGTTYVVITSSDMTVITNSEIDAIVAS